VSWARFVFANLRRSPLRTALTGGAIALAVLLVSLLLTMPAGLNVFLDQLASDTRISVVNEAGLVYPMPYAYARKVRALEGVEDVCAMVWFGGAFEDDGRVTFPNFAVETDHVATVFADYAIDPDGLADFVKYRDGAIVGRQTMQKYGWKVGERVTLRSTVWPVDLDVRIVAEIPNDRAPLVWLNRVYLDEALKAKTGNGLGIAGILWVRVTDAKQVNPVMLRIDELTRNSEAETTTQTERSFFASFFGSLEGFVQILLVVTALVALCIVFIAANTASMAVRERVAEIATLKAMGFPRGAIFASLLAETVLLSSVAGVVGIGLATTLTGALRAAAGWNPQLGPLGGFLVTEGVVVQSVGLSLAIGVVAGLAPALGAARKPVAVALREVV